MPNRKLMMLVILFVSLLAISAVSAGDNVTEDIASVDETTDTINVEDSDIVDSDEMSDDIASADLENDDIIGIEDADSDIVKNDASNEVLGDDKLMVKSVDDSIDTNEQPVVNVKENPTIQAAENNNFISKNVNQKDSKQSKTYSDASVYLQYIKTRYNSGKYFYLGWSGYFSGHFKVYKGNSLYHDEFLYGHDKNLRWSLEGMPVGTYSAKLVDYYGDVLGSTKIIIKKSSSKISVKSFSARAGSTFYCYAYVKDKFTGRNYDGGTVRFYIAGKVYKAKLKSGVAIAKIKIPSKIKKYKCKAKFSGGTNVHGKTTTFKMKVKTKYKTITTSAKKHWVKKYSGKYMVETKIWDMWRHSIGYYKYIDIFLYKNGKLVPNVKYATKYNIYGRWTAWGKPVIGTSHHRYPVYDNSLRSALVKVKFLND